LTENWNSGENGENPAMVMLRVRDSQNREVYSNSFQVTVQAVNDEPIVNNPAGDISLDEDETSYMYLNFNDMFFDVDYDDLYYDIEVDPEGTLDGEEITVDVNIFEQKLTFTPGEDYNTGTGSAIPLWVYCDDDPDVNKFVDGENCHQVIMVTVEPVNDPPIWSDIGTLTVNEDTPEEDLLDLKTKVTDIETQGSDLIFVLESNTHSEEVGVGIDENDMVEIEWLKPDWNGNAVVEVKVSDDTDSALTTFTIDVKSVNDAPSIDVTAPDVSDKFSGSIVWDGVASDVEGSVVTVEYKLDDGLWIPVEKGGPAWSHTWDTTQVKNGEHKFIFRGSDGELFSNEIERVVQVENIYNEAPLVSILDPSDGAKVYGTITFKGEAFDEVEVEKVEMRIGNGEWITVTGTVSWTYELDTSLYPLGTLTITVRSYDGELFSTVSSRNVIVITAPEDGAVPGDGSPDGGTSDPSNGTDGGGTPSGPGAPNGTGTSTGSGDKGGERGDSQLSLIMIIVGIIVGVCILAGVFASRKKSEQAIEGELVSHGNGASISLLHDDQAVGGAGAYGSPTVYQSPRYQVGDDGQHQMSNSPYAAAEQSFKPTTAPKPVPVPTPIPKANVAGYLPSGEKAGPKDFGKSKGTPKQRTTPVKGTGNRDDFPSIILTSSPREEKGGSSTKDEKKILGLTPEGLKNSGGKRSTRRATSKGSHKDPDVGSKEDTKDQLGLTPEKIRNDKKRGTKPKDDDLDSIFMDLDDI